jgi:trigger factor
MNITQKKIDDLSATLTVIIEKSDYEPLVKKNLNDHRRTAEIKGFRPGMAPMSLIEKLYGHSALLQEINKLLPESLNKYIVENNLNLLGEPIPSQSEEQRQDWKNPDKFEFAFEIGFAPEVTLTLSQKDKIPFYNITVTEEDKAKQKEAILRQNGKLVDVETIAGENEFLQVDLVQGEKTIENTYLSLDAIKEKAVKEQFAGKKAGDEWTVDVKTITANETDLAALLKVKKEELNVVDPLFTIRIKKIQQFTAAELNQELYDTLSGKDAVKSEEEFMQKIEAHIRAEYAHESNYRFSIDAYNALLEKANIELPEAFLKRWLLYSNDDKLTPEVVEKEFTAFTGDLRRQIIRRHILKEQQIELKQEELLEQAKKMARYQFQMYGLRNAPEENVERFAHNLLADEKHERSIREAVESDKVIDYVKATVTLDTKEITNDQLQKLYEKK